MSSCLINKLSDYINEQVEIRGWIHHIRRQGKKLIFVIVRDGSGFVQISIFGDLAIQITNHICLETYILVKGLVKKDERAPYLGIEINAENITIIGVSNTDFATRVQEDVNTNLAMDLRHLFIRGDNTSSILKLRAFILHTLRNFYYENEYTEITPPSIVDNSCEGGSTLFKLKYFEDDACLTQSSQLYLESAVPALGKVYCIHPSFRAEKSKTKRHLAEYTHVEMEAPDMTLSLLITHLQTLFTYLFKSIDENETIKSMIMKLNHLYDGFKSVSNFEILPYYKAIELCNELNILFIDDDNDNKIERKYVYGDDLTDKVERLLCSHINKPIFITQFPAEMKAFYMKQIHTERGIETDSCDLLFPRVGEIVGGSIRSADYSYLQSKVTNLQWYLDLRKYGYSNTGGYGIGLERIILYILGGDTSCYSVKDCCLYPRYMDHLKP